jgi:RNA polymerase sigma-70 factor (ECF subfamily)
MSGKMLSFRAKARPGPEISDDAIVAACGVGDTTALAELFSRYCNRVYRFLARMTGDPTDLEDLVQATFVEAYRSSGRFEGRASVMAWLLGISVNVMRHHLRGERRRRKMLGAAAEVLAHEARRPDDDVARNQLLGRLQRGLDRLPEDLRVVFVLRDVEGLKGADAARALEMNEGTFWRKLHEARVQLRAALQSRGEP